MMVEKPVTNEEKSMDKMTEHEKYEALENSKRCVQTTIQGVKVVLLKDDQTTTFTFTFTGQPGEITQEEFMAAYGSQDPDFVYGLIGQLANATSQSGYPDVDSFKFALSAVRGVAPRDPIEAQLLVQNAMMLPMMTKLANCVGRAEEPAEIESAERAFNRLSRTFCAVTAAFDRHRNGDQKIAVQQVSIAGGRAGHCWRCASQRREDAAHAQWPRKRREGAAHTQWPRKRREGAAHTQCPRKRREGTEQSQWASIRVTSGRCSLAAGVERKPGQAGPAGRRR